MLKKKKKHENKGKIEIGNSKTQFLLVFITFPFIKNKSNNTLHQKKKADEIFPAAVYRSSSGEKFLK